MKIKELKQKNSKPLNELQLSSILGDYGAAQQQQTFGFGGGRTKQDIMTQNIFIKNFVSNALSSLQTAVKGGVVDPNKKVIPKASAKDFQPQSKPTVATQADIGDFDLKDKMAKQKADQEQYRKDQEVANVGKERMARAAASPTSPEASAAVDARMQRAAQATQAQTPAPTSVDDRLERAAAQRGKTTESKYHHLNALFEAIMETVAVPDQDKTVYSVEQYLKKVWFPNYMKGVDFKANQQKIDQIIKQVADSYPKDGGRAALTQLANLSYAISPRKTKATPKKKKKKPAAEPAAKPAAEPAAKPEQVSVGGKMWMKGPQGWVDEKGEMASPTMAQAIDQHQASLNQPAEPVKAQAGDFAQPEKKETPFSGASTSGNVTTLKKTGTSESKKVKRKK